MDLTLIPVDTCTGTDELCVPTNKVADPNKCFVKCNSPLGGNGACVATYIVESTSQGKGLSATLGDVGCNPGETCTPCISPLDQSVTHACDN